MKINYHMLKSAPGLIIIGNQLYNIASFISFIFWCMFHSFILTIQDLYNSVHAVFKLLRHLLPTRHRIVPVSEPPLPKPALPPCGQDVTRSDVELVMKRLGLIICQGSLADQDVACAFNNSDPDLGEVREAFGVFDENKDGYIDARELNKVMGALGLVGFSQQEVERMILAFDEDGDGRIDFGEFVKLLEEC